MLWLLRVEFYGTLKCWSEGCFCCQPEVARALQGVGINVGLSWVLDSMVTHMQGQRDPSSKKPEVFKGFLGTSKLFANNDLKQRFILVKGTTGGRTQENL